MSRFATFVIEDDADLISIHKASPIRPDVDVRDVVISFQKPMPQYDFDSDPEWRQKCIDLYQHDADQILSALTRTLPGGTMDRLLILMLEYRATLLRCSMKSVQPVAPKPDELTVEHRRLRRCLAALVGSDDKAELEKMQAVIETAKHIPDDDKTNTINAIQALLATEPIP
jgi:hypothetical protein